MAIAVTEKVKESLGTFAYGVYSVTGLAIGDNSLSAGTFGMTYAQVVSMGIAGGGVAMSTDGVGLPTVSTPETSGIGEAIIITGHGAGTGLAVVIEVMGW